MARVFDFRHTILGSVAAFSVVAFSAARAGLCRRRKPFPRLLKFCPMRWEALQAASTALSRKSYAKAMEAVAKADAVNGKTDYETYTINQMRAAIASASGDHAAASSAYQALIASPRSSAGEKHQMMMALATNAYTAKDYGHAVTYIQQYLKSAGPNAQMRNLLVQAYYLQGDYAKAAKTQRAIVDAEIHVGHKPSENALQFLATCYNQTHQPDQETHAYVLLSKYYPKPDIGNA